MISALRESIKGRWFRIFLWIFIATLAGVFSLPIIIKEALQRRDAWAVMVNGSPISYAQYANKVVEQEQRISQLRQQYGAYADMFFESMGFFLDPKRLAFESLVRESLVNQSAAFLSLHLNQEYVAQKLQDPLFVQRELADVVPLGVVDSSFGINQNLLMTVLKRSGRSIAAFEQEVDCALQRRLMMQLVANAAYEPKFMLRLRHDADNGIRRYEVAKFSLDPYIQKAREKGVSKEQLTAFFDKNLPAYRVPEKRSGSLWVFDPQSYGIAITEEAVQKYYENHKKTNYIEKPALLTVRKIEFGDDGQHSAETAAQVHAQAVANPSSFAQLAKEHSQDAATASQGGLVEPFARGTYDREFEKAAFALAEDGAISDVLRTHNGFVIVQRVSKGAPEYTAFKDVRKDIERSLTKQRFSTAFLKDMKELVGASSYTADELQRFLKSKDARLVTKKLVSKDDSKEMQEFFKAKKGIPYFYSYADKGYVILVEDIERSYVPALNAVEDQVKNDYFREQAQNELRNVVRIVKERSFMEPFEALKKEFSFTVDRIDSISKRDSKVMESLRSRGLPAEKIMQLAIENSVLSDEDAQGVRLIKLVSLQRSEKDDFNEKKVELFREMNKESAMAFADGYVASLYRNATLKLSEDLLTQNK